MEKLPEELLERILKRDDQTVEFKKPTEGLTKDVYTTVCAFSNHDGGHIFWGVLDNGEIVGVKQEKVDSIKKDRVHSIMQKLIKQILKFGIVGFICFFIDFAIYTISCNVLGVPYLIAKG